MTKSFSEPMLGILGGSGVYALDDLTDVDVRTVETPWGNPSDNIVVGKLNDTKVAFLARHGQGHRIPPGDINYRANIDALKQVGVTDLISISACGSFRSHLKPGTFVLVDQFIDRTHDRVKSFFGQGCVAHVSMAQPVCHTLGDRLEAACQALSFPYQRGGTYLAMEGPQFSSKAESHMYRSWGCDVIGMTNMPEAKLAREAELPYATVAMVTDFDCWHEDEADVEVTNILEVMHENASKGRALVDKITSLTGAEREPSGQGIENVLDFAIVTAPEHRDPALVKKLQTVAGRVLSET